VRNQRWQSLEDRGRTSVLAKLATRENIGRKNRRFLNMHPNQDAILERLETTCQSASQQWLQAHAPCPTLHQFPIGKADLSHHRSRHRSALLVVRRLRPLSLQRLDVPRSSLLQQLLQGAPVVQTAAHLQHELFRNVDRDPTPLQSAVQNVARMLFAGHARRAVLAHTRAATEAQ
jgi:hypothetical protein